MFRGAQQATTPRAPRIVTAVAASAGERPSMQDRYAVVQKDGLIFLAIVDGHGGAEAAQLASTELPKEFYARIRRDETIADALRASYLAVGHRTRSLESGVTAATAVLGGNVLTVANVGDVRAILLRDGRAKGLTRERRLTSKATPRRIARALKPGLTAEPYVHALAVHPGDMIVMASDGLWDTVPRSLIVDTLRATPDFRETPARLLSLARTEGGEDSTTVVAALVR